MRKTTAGATVGRWQQAPRCLGRLLQQGLATVAGMVGGGGREEGEEGAVGATTEEGYGRLEAATVVVEEERRWWSTIVVGEEEGGRYDDDGDDDDVDDDGGDNDDDDKRSNRGITVGTPRIAALIPIDRTPKLFIDALILISRILGFYHGGRRWKRG
ncbi:hypothetical protein BHE74_00011390 [Ensete ventricosum]|nr:hypothetical protein GW17_00047091 [Ensete ventricosum]RWW80273.1 hypothetical protein BHE74_00011390 [Ensete ventricosum]RZR76606.1 hypothetical protein BHM03_00001429 [Ensete ventricosum]